DGGWCDSIETCTLRKTTALGSSNHMEQQVQFSGILSHDPKQNPDRIGKIHDNRRLKTEKAGDIE
ncbi:Pectin acetylesterase 12, partial [Bienertia sinuspersici]